MKRILAAAMALAVLFSLAACGAQKETIAINRRTEVPTTVATQPPQQELPAEETEAALRRVEYSALAAAFSLSEYNYTISLGYLDREPAYITDVNGDGSEEFVYGSDGMILSLDPKRRISCDFSQSGFSYFTDNEGTLYRFSCLNDSYSQEEYGKWFWYDHVNEWYQYWDGSGWADAFVYSGEAVYPQLTISGDGSDVTYDFDAPLTYSFHGYIYGQMCSAEELEAHFKEIGLTEISSTAADYTRSTFDPAYTDSLLAALDAYLSENYSGYAGAVTSDVDGDGYEETLFLIPNFDDVWYSHADPGDEFGAFAKNAFVQALPQETDRTAVLLADQKNGQLELQALCATEALRPGSGLQAKYDGGFLWLNGRAVFVPGGFSGGSVYEYLSTLMDGFGFASCLFKQVDVTDFPGTEYLGMYQRDGIWYLIIFVLDGSTLTPVYTRALYDSAVYLVEHDGKQCLLAYSQWMYTTMSGNVCTTYDYNLYRIGTDGWAAPLDTQSVSYFSDDADATAVAAFFEKLNVYLVKIIVLRDPYRLAGHVWLKQEEADYGTVPAEPEQPEETQEPVMGFVQINDPSSWLNLREGPGTEYACVLVDPNDPDSFVKQALGSPVTVLETVETGDAANPVWLKVRITYADREIVGYSSKTYIRIPSEE